MRPLLRGLLAVVLSVSAAACSAKDSAGFEEGKQYKKVMAVQPPSDPKRISVEEFFWYGCPHCYAFDPDINKWLKTKPADVDFIRVPNSLGHPQGLLHSKAFYTAEALQLYPQLHTVLFDAIHKDNLPMNTQEQIGQVFAKAGGVKPDVFAGTFNSFVVEAQVNKAEQLARTYGVISVPTIIVGGKYMTSVQMAGGHDQTLTVINQLVDKIRQERGLKK
ncbi:thiol:disulfide interchange protein DsbA [Solimonas aquatica]|uniref:Thiol:disulfide interchange protein n=1 Tax=Solimonas aquatica TaxID=489703 RepID=A0A1H9EKE8_9GAMM|nr:thiol:disulfide interchange protein DsbA/DsbL [Solimonas aquatica]SEQ26095.1 thiol:disulfide interchange protein DsbA [Solimonas aquatica]